MSALTKATLSSDDIAQFILSHLWDLRAMASASAVCQQWRLLASQQLHVWDEQQLALMLPGPVPQGTAVRILAGPHQGTTARVATKNNQDGNGPSHEWRQAGLYSVKELDDLRFAVVVLAEQACVVALLELQIVNSDLFRLFQRVRKPSAWTLTAVNTVALAATVLAECLMEGKGGLSSCMLEGAYYFGSAAGMEHPYAWKWNQYTRGNTAIQIRYLEVPPDFNSLAEAEAYFSQRQAWTLEDAELFREVEGKWPLTFAAAHNLEI